MEWSGVSSAVTRIGEQLIQEAKYIRGVKDQVERLHRELQWMQSFLLDADTRRSADERIHLWISQVKNLASDAEDVIDTYALKRNGGNLSRYACIFREGRRLHNVRSEIEGIITKVSDLTRQLQTYGVKGLSNGAEGSSSSADHQRRRPFPHIIEDNIVGLDDDIKKLVSVLVDDDDDKISDSNCKVVSICGMGGLGKTTLAKMLYHHSQVRNHFDHLAWIFVSQQFQRRKLWEDILSSFQIMEKEDKKKRDEELAEKLYNFLKEKKCLVILDDIWSTEAWDSIKVAFPLRETTSTKLLLTSRSKEVVSHADRRGHMHELQLLNDEQSWELLFQKIAFLDQRDYSAHGYDPRMEELGKRMVKHCAGLPLAIIVLGGILCKRKSLHDWQIVCENVKSYLRKGKDQGIVDVFKPSYDDLPTYIRPCFLYLSHFPEDYEIQTDRLIKLWIAEGLISIKHDEDGGETLEDVGECYLIELVERYMIQSEKRDVIGRIKTCRIHDVIRDGCLLKAKQENFFHIIDHSDAYPLVNNYSSALTIDHKISRVAAHQHLLVQCIKNPHLRSLLFFPKFFPDEMFERYLPQLKVEYDDEVSCNIIILPIIMLVMLFVILPAINGTWTHILNNFKLLRVLDFEGEDNFGGCKLSDDLGNLIHLRFLSLRNFSFLSSKLPSCLGNLKCLQTLDLRLHYIDYRTAEYSKVHVPNVIWKLRQLRHLYLPEYPRRKPRLRLNTLVHLQTLVNFNMKNCYVADLLRLINLRELEIVWISGAYLAFEKHLIKNPQIITSKHLRCLSFQSNCGFGFMDPTYLIHFFANCASICELRLSWVIMSKLPQHHHFPLDMAYVSLKGIQLEVDPMPTLEKLPNLRILSLDGNAFTGKKMVCSARGFPKLDSLSLKGLHNLEEWKVDEGAMLDLRHLEISYCGELKKLPDGLKFIATLQQLKIVGMPKTFQDKLVPGGEDFHIVQHVSSIISEHIQDSEYSLYKLLLAKKLKPVTSVVSSALSFFDQT
ncbi:Disease resistance protein [Corchorus capsularis]|uniref:Disease resistance protein n=1 Tax=Corchorus capsularis TaxID=210143 RepID=A0A1R3J0W5_COCAP|nr:Disease resistance protein [Corchorus capsularis]